MDQSSGIKLVIIFLIILLLKLVFIPFIQAPSAVNDEYVFSKMAQSFFYEGEFKVHEVPSSQYTPLYPIILSFSFLANNMQVVYTLMKLTNLIISSLVIFPAFLLAREFMKEKHALLSSVIIAFLPSHFIMSHFLLSENLFYPLFLLTFYFAYKAYTKNNLVNFLFLGILTGFSFLARPTAIAFIPAFIFMFVFQFFKGSFKIKNLSMLFLSLLVSVFPWFLRNGLNFGWGLSSILGRTYVSDVSSARSFSPLSYIISVDWVLIYMGVIILATLLVFPLFSLLFLKNVGWKSPLPWLFFFTVFSFLLVAAAHGSSTSPDTEGSVLGRLSHTRHVDQLLPLVVIFGMAGLDSKRFRKKELLLVLALIVIAIASIAQLILGSQRLLPPNNASLTSFGVFFEILSLLFSNIGVSLLFITLFIIVAFLMLLLFRRIFPYIFLIFVLITSLAGSVLVAYNSNAWADTGHKELGLWLADRTSPDSLIVYDKESCVDLIQKSDQSGLCESGGLFIPSAFWLNSRVIIGSEDDAEGGYFITSRVLEDKNPVKVFNNFRVYTFFNGENRSNPL